MKNALSEECFQKWKGCITTLRLVAVLGVVIIYISGIILRLRNVFIPT